MSGTKVQYMDPTKRTTRKFSGDPCMVAKYKLRSRISRLTRSNIELARTLLRDFHHPLCRGGMLPPRNFVVLGTKSSMKSCDARFRVKIILYLIPVPSFLTE